MEGYLEEISLKPFDSSLRDASLYPLTSSGISVFQVNLGRLCNQACRHCHVTAGPKRDELMGDDVLGLCIEAIKEARFEWVDITGGAPEMHPGYKKIVREASRYSNVRVRTNLTILLQEGFGDIPGFLAENNVEVVASLPYYLEETVDRQRGKGVFKASIEALKALNSIGYGRAEGRTLNLVYNPCGAFLPPSQKAVEADFRRELEKRHGVRFNSLFTLANMPVGRFLEFLKSSGNLERYMERLFSSYNPQAASNVMCRSTLSVDWRGVLYDCDFNQVLGIRCGFGAPSHLRDFDLNALLRRRIATGPHCYGCTAGAGSSCTGAVA